MNKKSIIQLIIVMLIGISLGFVVTTCIVFLGNVPTGSMSPTIKPGDYILGNRFAYQTKNPSYGDIIIFSKTAEGPDGDSERVIKRIVGMPGDNIEIFRGRLFINGEEIEDGRQSPGLEKDLPPQTIPEDCYFVMGDNRDKSYDSRYWEDPFVEKDMIIAKLVCIFFPIGDWQVF
uniref:signal peptidase I n=1 Tax=Lachnoclostridium phocaeense TaxID=1871021 RepID=UPI0026DC94DC|nr:signal peptidase I [Lachnoclostridium phocaeense]